MRTYPLSLGLACVACCAACGGRTSSDIAGATGAGGGSGGSGATDATGGSSATNAMGGSGATSSMGGSGATSSMGSGGATTGGNLGGSGNLSGSGATTSATGGTGGTKVWTGGATTGATTGGSGATTSVNLGGSSATTSATGGKGSGGGATTGGSNATGGTGGDAGTSGATITSCNDDFPFLGTWVGNILDFYFEPKEALRLELRADASGVVTGKLTWSEGAPPPAPQGADIHYPPGYWEQRAGPMTGFDAPEPWPGFAYTIVRGAGCDTTFRFGVSTSELWRDWCALQTPVYTPDFGWACTLQGGGSSDGTTCTVQPQNGGAWVTYPLWKCEACGGPFSFDGGVCACDEHSCSANTTATQTFDLTHSVSGNTEILSGPDPSCVDCTVRLEHKK